MLFNKTYTLKIDECRMIRFPVCPQGRTNSDVRPFFNPGRTEKVQASGKKTMLRR
jgi:hypothetical protein